MMFVLSVALLSAQSGDTPLNCDDAASTPEINACLAQDVEKAETRMRTYLDAALTQVRDGGGRYSAVAAAQIADSQTTWVAYAEQACGAVYSNWAEGTIRGAMALSCKLDLAQERTRHLWFEYLTYPDSTPPILPEPEPWWRKGRSSGD